MDNPNAFSNYVRQHATMDSASQKLTWVISKEKQQNMDPASWKLTGEETLSPATHQVDACFGDDYLFPTKGTLDDLPSLASPKGEMASSFSWTSLFKSPTSSTLCFGDPTLAKLNQVKLLCETEFCITKYILICTPVVHTGTTFLLTSKTLPHKPKMYKHSTTPSEVQSGETEEATPMHLTKAYKSLSQGTEDTSAFDQVLSVIWQMNAMLLTQVPCPITSTSYPGS